MTPSLASAQRLVVKIGSALVVDPDEAAPRTAWLDGVAADIALAARARRRRDRRLLRRHRAGPPLARPAPAPPAPGGTAGRRRRRPDPPGAGLERGTVRQGPHRRAAAADARRHRGPPPLPQRARHAEHAARPRLHPGDQRERHRGDRGNPLRRQRPPRRARRRDDAGRPARAAVRHRRPLHRRSAARSSRGAYPDRCRHHAGDRGDGGRAAARLFVRRHAHQAGGGAHRHAGRLRDGDRLSAIPTARLPRSKPARAAPGSSPRPKAARHASAGSRVRWRRSARWWWMPAPHARLPADVRCCRPACARSRARSSAAIRSWCAMPDGKALARGLSAYASADAERIAGHRSDEIEAILGWRGRDEIIHRDDLVLL